MDNIGAFNAVLIDQIPPFDITILFANETGSMSKLVIYGVELVQEGQTMSVEDLVTESVVNFVARHFEPMESLLDPYSVDFGKDAKKNFPSISFTNITANKTLQKLLASLK
jgi:hypothetical protein